VQERPGRPLGQYDATLRPWAEAPKTFQAPTVPSHCAQAYHMYYLLPTVLERRQALMRGCSSGGDP